MNDSTGAPLMENPHVKEFLSIMRSGDYDPTNLGELLNHVTAMENYVASAVSQLINMRRELADMKEIQNHPIKSALRESIKTLEQKTNAAIENLKAIKAAIIDGCKNAVAAFKEHGKAALNGIMKFFHIKDGLQAMKNDLTAGIQADSRAIAKIDTFSQQYHEAGKAAKNMGRALRGKELEQNAKPVGRVAKSLQAPFRANRSVNVKMRNAVVGAIGKLEQLDADMTARKEARAAVKEEKRSLLERLDENKERVAREDAARPMPARNRALQEAAI